MNEDYYIDFCLEIRFQKYSKNPSRVFRATSSLIEAFQELDVALAHSIDVKIKPILLLQDIESGSIRTWLRTILTSIDSEALKELSWKKIVGSYLVKGKEKIVNWLSDKKTISDRREIESLQQEIYQLAEQTEVRHVPAYARISSYRLLTDLEKISTSLSVLDKDDEASYITSNGTFPFNLSFKIASEAVEELGTKEIIANTAKMILQVKKPDFLGESMWDFKHQGRIIQAKIVDLDWLHGFHAREFIIAPGDSIRVMVSMETKYGYDNDVVATHYLTTEVLELLPLNGDHQGELFSWSS